MEVVQRAFNVLGSDNLLSRFNGSEEYIFYCQSSNVFLANGTSPLLPGTREMYKTKGSFLGCVGFRGYEGGFDANAVKEDRDFASMTVAMLDRSGTHTKEIERASSFKHHMKKLSKARHVESTVIAGNGTKMRDKQEGVLKSS
jgi:hypothetical protein